MRPERTIRISIDVDRCLLTWMHVGQARFAEIGLDPDASARQQREHGGARIDEVADLEVLDPRHDAVVGRRNRRIGKIEPGAVELGLGCADRRVAIDLDVWIAARRKRRRRQQSKVSGRSRDSPETADFSTPLHNSAT